MPPQARAALTVILAASLAQAGAAVPNWLAVPGAPGIELDAGSIDPQRGGVTARVRLEGQSPVLRGAAFEPVGPLPRHHRRVVTAQFDCGRRTVRALALQASDASERTLYLASSPGTTVALPAQEGLDWLYDALCELARTRAAER